MATDEVTKLQNHLRLLRAEYVKLQSQLADVEHKYQIAQAACGENSNDNFISRLLKTVSSLFNNDLYSDIVIRVKDGEFKGHRFVLSARSDDWGIKDLTTATEVDLSDLPRDVAVSLLQWVYQDEVEMKSDDVFLLDLLKAASRFSLHPLVERCEKALISSVNVRNCIQFYQTCEELKAEVLKQHCSELISNHWNDFTSEDFATMPAALAYKMFKTKSEFPLHTAVRIHREDIVFLYLVEMSKELPAKLDEIDSRGDIALDIALQDKLESIAQTLVDHKADVNRTDHSGKCLLHKAIMRGDEFASRFLIKHGVNVNITTNMDKDTALHLTAAFNPDKTSQEIMTGMSDIANLLVESGAMINAQTTSGSTPIMTAINNKNEQVFSILLQRKEINLELQTVDSDTALWLALKAVPPGGNYDDASFAARLLQHGANLNATSPDSGDCLLHKAARMGHENAALFLTDHGANVNIANQKGETPLHTGCWNGLGKFCQKLLEKGANPNAQTMSPIPKSSPNSEDSAPYKLTPLHIAIANKHEHVVDIFLKFKGEATHGGNNMLIIPNFTIKDSQDQTVLALALWNNLHQFATQLLSGGANINDFNSQGLTLLHQAIEKHDAASALFLLEKNADANIKTEEGRTCLQLAISRHLPAVVNVLCQRGANMNVFDESGDCPLWMALESGQEDVASIMVQHGCNTDMWSKGPGDCQQTLLHRAIDESNESVACFLIRSMCDVNSPRRPGPNGEGDEEARDGMSPLHLAASWGLERIIQGLVEHNANINSQDAEGKAPIHIAIENQHSVIISLLMGHPRINLSLKDKLGMTPFAAAMMTKNNKAAQAILDREPTATEQFDNKGRNFLHMAVMKSDIESVLFLISVRANVNSRVQDASKRTPLQIAVAVGSEIIVRNLLLAGAQINEVTPSKRSALHIAAEHDHAAICSILIDNHIDVDSVDDNWNNALHVAVQQGHLSTVRILLTESRINAEAYNSKGYNPMHILGQYGKESAAAIFELFMECMPEYPLDRMDEFGNTALLLAYMNGNGNLCRAIVRAGAALGVINKEGLSIFNAPVATKQLLFKLLDMLSKEPPWVEGETCQECSVRFGIKTRKHHCRHCGRLLCSKCSSRDVPIIKYNIPKPVRVCEICFDVLTLGGAI